MSATISERGSTPATPSSDKFFAIYAPCDSASLAAVAISRAS